jgi:parallel beta-helix repeat protein
MRVLGLAARVALLASCAFLAFSASEALATHVGCGDTITTDTTLDSDLIDCPGDGVVIGADDIRLDLNGHTIEGTGIPSYVNGITSEYGVENAGHSDVTIENGEIEGFEYGVELTDADRNHLRGLEIYGTGIAIALYDSNENRIEANSSFRNGYGFYSERSNANRVDGNAITSNTIGIYPIDSDYNDIGQNVVSRSGVVGIELTEGSDGNTIRGNSVDGSGAYGILVSRTTGGNRVVANSVSNHPLGGIVLSTASNIVVADNALQGNLDRRDQFGEYGSFGIAVDAASSDNRLSGNVVRGSRTGILVARSERTTLRGNAVLNNSRDGIAVIEAIDTWIGRTRADGNEDDGIDVDAAKTLLRANEASRNGDLGIEAVEGVFDGGGNKASGNGNPLQCLNVFCK